MEKELEEVHQRMSETEKVAQSNLELIKKQAKLASYYSYYNVYQRLFDYILRCHCHVVVSLFTWQQLAEGELNR